MEVEQGTLGKTLFLFCPWDKDSQGVYTFFFEVLRESVSNILVEQLLSII